jgi:hypothetical protein
LSIAEKRKKKKKKEFGSRISGKKKNKKHDGKKRIQKRGPEAPHI